MKNVAVYGCVQDNHMRFILSLFFSDDECIVCLHTSEEKKSSRERAALMKDHVVVPHRDSFHGACRRSS